MTCPTCQDTRTVSRPVGVGDLMGTEPCECAKEPETCDGNQHSPNCDATYPHPQPAPEHGPASEPVELTAEPIWEAAADMQYDKGLAKYGTPLHTFNGRDAAADCRAEMVDAHRYLTQLEMERDALAALLRRCVPVLMVEAGEHPSEYMDALLQDIHDTGILGQEAGSDD